MNACDYFAQNCEINAVISRCMEYFPDHCFDDLILRIWEVGGLLHPQWDDNYRLKRSWLNVVAHMAVSATLGYNLALNTKRHGVSLNSVVRALLLHDWFKRQEQEGGKTDKEGFELLLKMGIPEHVVSLASTTGDIGIERMLSGDADLDAMIVFYADCCTSNYQVTTYKRRFDDLKPHFEEGGRYFHLGKVFAEKHGKTHREVYDSIVIPIETKLAGLLGHDKKQESIPLLYSPNFVHQHEEV